MGSGVGQKMSLTFSVQSNTLDTTTNHKGDNMKIGDLVKNIYSHELFVITSEECNGYYDVYTLETGKTWLMPTEHLEVIK